MSRTLGPLDLVQLPVPRAPIVGRQDEIARASQLLHQPSVRWLTFLGPGGVGKTRLAIELAVQAQIARGAVCFVALASLRDPALVLPTIAQALGIADQDGGQLHDLLRERLNGQRLLLVLDNMEQIAAAAPTMMELVDACPGVTILATSRAPLHLPAEKVLRVSPLAVPDLAHLPPPADLAGTGAISLFIDRARVVDPGFMLSAANAATVAEICARVDGLPLAIELAAIRLQVLSLTSLLERLSNRLTLLTRGSRDLPDRQRTLRATIGWSDDLLGPVERALLRSLAVFAGGCDTVAVENVCAGWVATGALGERISLLDALAELLDNGLLQRHSSGGEPRFAMLETIQEYALEQLEISGNAGDLRQQHATYYLALAEEAEIELGGADQRRWLDRLEIEHDNIRAVLAWAVHHHEDEIALRLAAALWKFWWLRGHLVEGQGWFDRVLDRGETLPLARAKALNAAGELAERHNDYDRATFWYQQALPLWETLGDQRGLAGTLAGLGFVAMRQGRYGEAMESQEHALTVYRRLEDRRRTGELLNSLGTLLLDQGHYDRAQALCSEALELYQEMRDTLGTSIAFQNLGYVAFLRQDYQLAESLYEESLARRHELGDSQGVAHVLANLAENARHRGDVTLAVTLCHEALHLFRELGDKRGTAYACYELGQAARERQQGEPVLSLLIESLDLFHQVGERWAIARCLEALAGFWTDQGDATRGANLIGAADRLREELDIPVQTVDQQDHTRTLAALGAALTNGRFEEARAAGRAWSLDLAMISAREPAAGSPAAGYDSTPETYRRSRRLSAREREVLHLLVQGCTDREIAELLSISPRTASTHMTNIFRKLGENSRTAVVAYAVRHHLG